MDRKGGVMERVCKDEKGSVILLCVMILFIITLGGIAALNVTSVEFQVSRSDRLGLMNFQNAEAGLAFAIGEFRSIYLNKDDSGNTLYTHSSEYTATIKSILPSADNATPLRDIHPTIAGVSLDYRLKDTDGAETGPVLARVEIRCITFNAFDTILSDLADNTPGISHIAPAPQGYDQNEFCSRLFAITSTAMDPTTNALTSTSVQGGIYYPVSKDRFLPWAVF